MPALIIVALGTLLWSSTHKLDPYKALASENAPLEVEVVAQDWKWLFIYPKQKIATVNELVFPSGTPLSLKITSDTVMNSFFIPALGGQIYAMAGMQSRLHLLADAPGRFAGRNTQYSGAGFSRQHFEAVAESDYASPWLHSAGAFWAARAELRSQDTGCGQLSRSRRTVDRASGDPLFAGRGRPVRHDPGKILQERLPARR